MKKHKGIIIAAVFAAICLVLSYWWGGSSPGMHGWDTQPENKITRQEIIEKSAPPPEVLPPEETIVAPTENEAPPEALPPETVETAAEEDMLLLPDITEITVEADASIPSLPEFEPSPVVEPPETKQVDEKTDEYVTKPAFEGKIEPIEPQNASIADSELTCTLSVRCDTVLDNLSWLDSEKAELVPNDGIILAEKEVTFYEGESVFNLLTREMKKNKIHMEFVNTPVYNSAYIEGIGNLYEFDCGELSGWMYRVNGWFPNYGCSRYQLQAGDKVEWVYTCDLGADVGGEYSTQNGK